MFRVTIYFQRAIDSPTIENSNYRNTREEAVELFNKLSDDYAEAMRKGVISYFQAELLGVYAK